MIQIRDKEHQSLGIKELKQLAFDYPNDAELGNRIRLIIHKHELMNYKRPANAFPTPTTGG